MIMTEAQQTRPKVLAAIPCFNTEPFIADVVSNAKKYVDQVVVINDGSHDGTAEAARTAGAVVINHGANRGYRDAIQSPLRREDTWDYLEWMKEAYRMK
ncbi:glycosyltransferase [Dehalococcoidia bacterium]|nr:glycosyltransferase [Dehalococcoidia bacterium]